MAGGWELHLELRGSCLELPGATGGDSQVAVGCPQAWERFGYSNASWCSDGWGRPAVSDPWLNINSPELSMINQFQP